MTTLRSPSILFGAVLAVLAGLMLPFVRPAEAAAIRPNFVVIQTDDQSSRLLESRYRGASGKFRRTMPHAVRMILRSGTEFTNYYATSPVCTPSRASLLTGQYVSNHGLQTNVGAYGGWRGWQRLPLGRENLPVALQEAGYRTAHLGKFLNGYFNRRNGRVTTAIPPGFDSWFTMSYRSSSNRFYGYEVNDNGFAVGPFGDRNYGTGRGLDPAACRVDTRRVRIGGRLRRCNYGTDVITRRAVASIENSGPRPFFMQIDYESPHGDVRPPEGPPPATRHMGTASRTPLPRSPDFNEANFSDKPAIIRYAAPRKMNRKEIRARAAAYRRQIEAMRSVDQGIGEVMRALRRTGELANTYVFILSDHGTFLGEHRFSHGKFLAYEEAASVSMAVRGPGVPRGARSAEVVGNIDVPATIFDLAGAAPRYPVDGRSLEPFWKDPRRKTRRGLGISLLAPVRGGDGPRAGTSDRSPSWRYRAFRVGPYKYINYWWAGEHEMYDLRRDPFELENVYGNPAYADVRAYMERHIDRFSKCQGAACQVELPPWPEPST